MTEKRLEAALEAARWQSEVSEVYDLVVSGDKGFRVAGNVLINADVTAKIQDVIETDVSEYVHVIDTYTLRHILKTHGQLSEVDRGQIPLVKNDFLQLLDVLTSPDTVTDAGVTRQGLRTVLYTKVIQDEEFFFVQSIESGRKRLRPVTMYKRRRK